MQREGRDMTDRTDFASVLLDHLDECPVCTCPRITFGVPAEGVCECECHDPRTTLETVAWLHEDEGRCNHVETERSCTNPHGEWLPLYRLGRDRSEP